MKKIAVFICILLSAYYSGAKIHFKPVFISGQDGYKSYRIPAIVSLKDGTLLAFCEGRVHGANDFGDIDIVMKRSIDQGMTWSVLKVVADNQDLQLCNPAPVLDATDPNYPNGRLFLFYNSGNRNEGDIIKGIGIKHCLYKTSTDGGKTWSDPVDITTQVHRPFHPEIDPQYNFKEDWRYYANTPGHAMQFLEGKYRGRIFVAANHSAGNPKASAGHYVAHGYYTDDHGRTFKLGNSLSLPGSNESMAVELTGGALMMNSRNQRGDVRARIVSLSKDGGSTWDTTFFDKQLTDPVCQGSILNIGKRKGKNVLAFCNAADTLYRNNLTLRISFDEGKSWARNILLYRNQEEMKHRFDYAAYSDLVNLKGRKVGVLFEKDNYSQIVFVSIPCRKN